MKNRILLSITIIFLFFGCKNASDKIKENNETEQTTQTNPVSNLTKPDNGINAQIIDNDGSAAFEFTNEGGTVWNFGTIQQGDSPEFSFTFKNTGNEPMIISNAKGSCGCTVPQWPKDPIPPGENGEIAVKFNSKGKENCEKGREKEKESGNVRKRKNENVIEKENMKEKEETDQGRESESVVDVIKQPKKFGKSKIRKTKKETAKKQKEKPGIRKQVIKNV
jgi:hypothetical protein